MNKEDAFPTDSKKAKWGCLTWMVILIIVPLVLITGVFLYEMYYEERLLKVSNSPSNQFTIEIVEKGSAFWFGPSKVRIKYKGGQLDRAISNDGSTLSSSNVEVNWDQEDTANVTLYGDEQQPETIEIDFTDEQVKAVVIKEDVPGFKSSTVQSNESPNGQYRIEIREMTSLPDEGHGFHSIRVYYGKANRDLMRYEDYEPYQSEITSVDEYRVNWEGDERVSVKLIKKIKTLN
ncbi:hypothetical protein [Bacillus sp. P14.5]|uniref:hypothetical protein n=1 Tax=Bacillus sp. P14.5 TaxID=1983400 RepID=UPI000DEA37D3|nr:hypothetical protein [Bacillus sp. P14.5]